MLLFSKFCSKNMMLFGNFVCCVSCNGEFFVGVESCKGVGFCLVRGVIMWGVLIGRGIGI